MDLPACKKLADKACQWDKDTFEAFLGVCVGKLMWVHNRRWDGLQKGKKR